MSTEAVLPSSVQNFLTWQARYYSRPGVEKAPPATGPFITLSREYGCEGFPLANAIADRLNKISAKPTPWVVMGKEIIDSISQKRGAASEFVDALSHSRRGYIQQTVEILFGRRPTEYQAYETLVQSLVSLADAGRVILVGRGGAIVCGGLERGVHIRLVAPLSWRSKKISADRGMGIEEAEALVFNQERIQTKFVRDFTGKDVSSPLNYDFVFNNERNSVNTIADMVMVSVKMKNLI